MSIATLVTLIFTFTLLIFSVQAAGIGVSATPDSQAHSVGEKATIVAYTYWDDGGNSGPLADTTIEFEIISGPNIGAQASSISNEEGIVEFMYSGEQTGTDIVRVTMPVGGQDPTPFYEEVTVIWCPKFVISEIPYGPLFALVAMIASFGIYYSIIYKNKKM